MMQGIPDTVKFDLEKSKGESTSEFSWTFRSWDWAFYHSWWRKQSRTWKFGQVAEKTPPTWGSSKNGRIIPTKWPAFFSCHRLPFWFWSIQWAFLTLLANHSQCLARPTIGVSPSSPSMKSNAVATPVSGLTAVNWIVDCSTRGKVWCQKHQLLQERPPTCDLST